MKIKNFCLYLILTLLYNSFAVRAQTTANDHIFPAADQAKPFIDFDSRGFIINRKRTFLVSAGLEYARMPRAQWHDRLLRLKRCGFNCIEIYTFWNFHEPEDNQFDFTGDHDLGAFLKIVKTLGMYAIVRVGPYYCAEWDNGGYPHWLREKKNLRVREDNPQFEYYVDRFFDHLLPVVFNQQINKGGAVVMVQLENEHPLGWGTIMPNNYFVHLRNKALSLGLQVPYFFSGLHHDSDPAGNKLLDDPSRPNPWFSTEFWSVWYSQYGASPGDSSLYERRTWKIISHGGNGYNYYMAYGGTNFAYNNNDEDAAAYDYGAAVGQAGDLRPMYYAFKRAALFARSFQDVLENSTDNSIALSQLLAVTDTTVKVTGRSGPAGSLVFIDNPGKTEINTTVGLKGKGSTFLASHIKITPGEIYPLVHHFVINNNVVLEWALTRISSIFKQGNTTNIMVDADSGSEVTMDFDVSGKVSVMQGDTAIKTIGNQLLIHRLMPNISAPIVYTFGINSHLVRVLLMTRKLTDKTWLIDDTDHKYIVSGAKYVSDVRIDKGKIAVTTENPLHQKNADLLLVFTENGLESLKAKQEDTVRLSRQLQLSQWESAGMDIFASVNFNDKKWLPSKNPLQMGSDGDLTANAWYRTQLNVPKSGAYSLQADGGDRATAFIDGKPVTAWKIQKGETQLNLTNGKHTLAIFTSHDGRQKLYSYLGPIDNIDNKGLSGKVIIKKGGPFLGSVSNWYFIKTIDSTAVKKPIPAFDTVTWHKYKIGDDAFDKHEGFGWFRAVIPTQQRDIAQLMIHFKSVDENATVFINGKRIMRHVGWNIPFSIAINDQKVLRSPIVLTLFIENYNNVGGINDEVITNAANPAIEITNWRMRGGVGNPTQISNWSKTMKTSIAPQFYRSTFINPDLKRVDGVYRVNVTGMGHGSVWINGYNIGRYPEKAAQIGMYIPECWLKPGKNSLIILDEDGKKPGSVNVSLDQVASRKLANFSN